MADRRRAADEIGDLSDIDEVFDEQVQVSVTDRPGKYVSIPAAGLVGRGDAFEEGHDTV